MVTQVASELELIVLRWLEHHKIVFEPQAWRRGGWFELGGSVVDFIVEPNLAWRIMGEYWHRGVEKEGTDIIQREGLIADGLVVVDIWEIDIRNKLTETMTKALQGEEMLH